MFVVRNRKYFYWFSGTVVALAILAIIFFGFNLGIDFRGGSLLQVNYSGERPSLATVQDTVASIVGGEPSVRAIGDSGYVVRMQSISEQEHQGVLQALSKTAATTTGASVEEQQFNSIGPVLGAESARKSLIAIVLVLLMIVSFIAFAFRKVSEPVSSWKYGVIAIVALAHDVLVPTGFYVVLGHFNPLVEVDTLFVTALLVILGFSVHDTIVVFDRVRENLRLEKRKPFDQIVGESISQTFTRSINTSLTVVLALLVLFFVGGAETHNFVLALLVGIIAGTYSSIFLGSPLLVTVEQWQRQRRARVDRKR